MEVFVFFAAGLVASWAATIDYRHHRLPNKLTGTVATLSAVGLGLAQYSSASLSFSSVRTWCIVVFVHLVLSLLPSAPVGMGDTKLIAGLLVPALLHSWWLYWLWGSYASASIIGLISHRGRISRRIAFGPFLVACWWLGFVGDYAHVAMADCW